METVKTLDDLKPGVPSVVTVGVFDGVHLGHQRIMQTMRAVAGDLGARSVVVTFDRNPQELVSSVGAPPYITTLRQKLSLIAGQGIDLTVVLPLERRLVNMAADEFASRILQEKLSAERVVVGADFAFGRGRAGDVKLLRETGRDLGFEVTVVSPVRRAGVLVSSTVIREILVSGEVEKAKRLLGHPFALEGKVVAGQGIGRSLGYPTANLQPAEKQIVPASGVYAVSAKIGSTSRTAVANIGVRPTIGGRGNSVEVHIIGFSDNIYGQELEVVFHRRLRDEVRFPDTDALREQIDRDVKRALQLVKQ